MTSSSRSSPSDLSARVFQRILLIKPSSLGDVVHALPVLHGLRARYPDATIEWLVSSPFAPLLEAQAGLDGIIRFDRRRFARIGRSLRVTREFTEFIGTLRARRYDLVIDLQGLFRTGFLAWASGAAVRIGFRQAREGAWAFYTHRLVPGDPNMHAVDQNYLAAAVLGFEDVPLTFDFSVSDRTRKEVCAMLESFAILEDERLVAVAPGARWETKRWPTGHFIETINRLHDDRVLRCVLVGGPDETEVCEEIAGACRTTPVNLAGRTTIPQLAAAIERADVLLCHDSAAMHLAVALDRPLVCLTGPTNPRRTGPYHRMKDVLRRDLSCSPCYFRRLRQCPHHHRCMIELDPAMVVQAVVRRLDCDGAPASTTATDHRAGS